MLHLLQYLIILDKQDLCFELNNSNILNIYKYTNYTIYSICYKNTTYYKKMYTKY